MFKKDWLVIAVYRKQGSLKAFEMIVEDTTKKQAIDAMYDYLCWDKTTGLKNSFRNIEFVYARKYA